MRLRTLQLLRLPSLQQQKFGYFRNPYSRCRTLHSTSGLDCSAALQSPDVTPLQKIILGSIQVCALYFFSIPRLTFNNFELGKRSNICIRVHDDVPLAPRGRLLYER
jgi:hypothetical protein